MRVVTVFCLMLLSFACGQDPPAAKQAPQQPDPQAVLDEVLASFKQEGIQFDNKAQTVSIPVVVNMPQEPVEYLLIHKKGKKHESVFWTPTKPSVLNAALLMLGLEPGRNATYIEKDPPPTLEEIQAGADPLVITEPKGTEYYMTVRWTTPEKKQVEYCVEDLLLDLTTQEPLDSCKWIYLGGRMACLYKGDPEVFMADFEGNLISICYLTPDNHLGTMVHERARDDQNWWTTTRLPEPGTEMTFVFHKSEPKIRAERQQRLRDAKVKPADKQDSDKKVGDGK